MKLTQLLPLTALLLPSILATPTPQQTADPSVLTGDPTTTSSNNASADAMDAPLPSGSSTPIDMGDLAPMPAYNCSRPHHGRHHGRRHNETDDGTEDPWDPDMLDGPDSNSTCIPYHHHRHHGNGTEHAYGPHGNGTHHNGTHHHHHHEDDWDMMIIDDDDAFNGTHHHHHHYNGTMDGAEKDYHHGGHHRHNGTNSQDDGSDAPDAADGTVLATETAPYGPTPTPSP